MNVTACYDDNSIISILQVQPENHVVAKTNFTYEKRQKELEKKRKKEEKLKRKQDRATDGTEAPEGGDAPEGSVEGLPEPVEGDSQTETP